MRDLLMMGLREVTDLLRANRIGPPRQEALLLRAGHAFECAAGFNRMRPPFLR